MNTEPIAIFGIAAVHRHDQDVLPCRAARWARKVFTMQRAKLIDRVPAFQHAAIRSQLRDVIRVTFMLFIPALVILSASLWVALQHGATTYHLTRDLASITGSPFYYGIFSQFGVLIWCATAAICLLSATVLQAQHEARRIKSFLLFSGGLTICLMLDDLLRVSDILVPQYLHLPSTVVSIAYLIAILFYVYRYKNVILTTNLLLLLCTLVLFGCSLAIDSIPFDIKGKLLAEDTFKLLGILGWFAYYLQVCRATLTAAT